MSQRPRGLIRRLRDLLRGMFASWLGDREGENPRAVYAQVIRERTRQYSDLKQAVAGILYMRNKLEAEIRQRRADIARLQRDIRRAVVHGDDPVALAMISQKEGYLEDLERAQRELTEIVSETGSAKANLVKFRGEIRSLEREKVRMLAMLANAKARRRVEQAFEGLSLDSDMKALEGVREQISRVRMESNLERELGDEGLESRVREIREEARMEAAEKELEELKRRLRPPGALPLPESEAAMDIVAS